MSQMRRIRWKWIFLGAFLAELTVIAIFFLLLLAATAAGVPEIAQPMTTLDYIDAMVMSFVSMLVFTIWVGKRIDSAFVLHGVLIGAVGILSRRNLRRDDRRKAAPARPRTSGVTALSDRTRVNRRPP
jgi:hypothetical protein